ncbi:hypothetical protein OHT52_11930 [Streptomyces sp. NBC_00247]|uniref:hypothetical protein n=1 Tax=Streptomyces sp. NBC_00247 TaxID=2975689 RepID=UPI002E2B267E|nr:hypothetical protein [Streptomyces sp. NBC_00247]
MNQFSCSSTCPGHGGPRDPADPVPAEPGRWPELEAALAVVNRDVRATLPGQEPLVLVSVPSSEPPSPASTGGEQVYVAMPDGSWQGNAVNAWEPDEDYPPEPDDPDTFLAVVAEAAQETLMELLRRVWPVCPAHGTGTHTYPPESADGERPGEADLSGPPAWWCGGGRGGRWHKVATVGELAAAVST